MARIPTADALSSASFGGGRERFQPAREDFSGQAATAQALTRVGANIEAIGRDWRMADERANNRDMAAAELEGQRRLMELDQRYERDPDYATAPQRYGDEAKAIGAELAGKISDPAKRQIFEQRFGVHAQRGQFRTEDMSWRRDADAKRADLDGLLDGYRKMGQGGDERKRAEIMSRAEEAIAGLAAKPGYLTREQAYHRLSKFKEQLEVDDVEQRIFRDPAGVLKDLEDSRGGQRPTAGIGDSSVLTSGKSRQAPAGWAARDPRWQGLDQFQKAAVMALMEADGADIGDAKNALGAMINRAMKNGEDLGAHVSQKIYQPTIEAAQQQRLAGLLKRPEFQQLTEWARARAAGTEADPVDGATHFLAHERVMEGLRAREPGKYKSWVGWSGYDRGGGKYTNPDGSPVVRDKSHAFLAPEGRYKPADATAEPAPEVGEEPTTGIGRYQNLSPERKRALMTRARTALSASTQQDIGNDIVLLEKGLEPKRDENGMTSLDRAARVLQPNQVIKLGIQWQEAQMSGRIVKPLRDMTPDAAERHLGEIAGQIVEGDDGGDDNRKSLKRVYDKAVREWRKVSETRSKDPAASVDDAEEVVAARRNVRQMREATAQPGPDGTVVTSKDSSATAGNEEIIAARIEAQKRRGIDAWHQRVISRAEADKLMQMPDTKGMSERDIVTKVKEAAVRAERWYGAYGQRAFTDAVSMVLKDQNAKDQAASLITKMARGEKLSQSDFAKYQSALSAEMPTSIMFGDGTINPAAFAPGIPAIGMTTFGAGRQALTDIAGGAAKGAAAQPGKKHTEWLMEDPKGRQATFDAKFGAGAAARALGGQR